jgi:antitoxin HigA-1
MARKNASQPMNPFHPGETLLSQAAFARKIGWTKARLNEFVRGKRGVTADAALDLGEALGTSARLWMNLQSTWDLSQAERRRRAA